MRTPGLAAITMAFAIAACSDVSAPTATINDPSSVEGLAHRGAYERDFGHKQECPDTTQDRRWGRRHHDLRFRHFGWSHSARHFHFRHNDDACQPPEPPPAATGAISGTVLNEGEAAVGFGVFLLNADGSVAANTLTDATGAYAFNGVAAAAYLVCEENPFTEAHGFLGEARPATGGACPAGTAYAPRGFSLTLAGGGNLTGNNFSNMQLN
jgi:hypothetical protein